jgi:hypothetical protein
MTIRLVEGKRGAGTGVGSAGMAVGTAVGAATAT